MKPSHLFTLFLLTLLNSLIGYTQTLRAEAAFNQADSLARNYDERASFMYDRSYQIAKNEGNTEIEFKSLFKKGVHFDAIGKGDSALFYLKKATATAISLKQWINVAKAKNSIGVVEFRAGNYTSSLTQYFDALKSAEKAKDSVLIFKITNNIGHVYFYIDAPKAKHYYEKNLVFSRQMRDSDAVADCYLNIANVYNTLDQNDSAIFLYKKALEYNEGEEELYARANILQNMAITEKALGHLTEAEKHLHESLLIFEKVEDVEGVAQSYVNLGDLFMTKKDWSKARIYFTKALAISKEINSKEGQRFSYEGLITVESSTNNFQKAFQHSQRLSEIKEQLLNNDIAAAVAKVEAVYQNEKKQLQIENLSKEAKLHKEEIDRKSTEIKLRNFQTIGLVVAFIFILIVSGIILFAYFQKQKANRSLNEKNRVIQRSLEENELLMKEIHHRAKNNLQVVSGLLSMQSLRLNDEKSKDAMLVATNRVKSMALIHEQLYHPGAKTDVEVKTYLDELSNSLFSSYNISTNNVTLHKNIQNIKLDVDLMIPIGIIANELMSNALKHAFNQIEHGLLSLKLSKDEHQIILQITDNGPGIPIDFNHETAKSFGMRLIHSLAKKIDAEIIYNTQQGTEVTIIVPLSKTYFK